MSRRSLKRELLNLPNLLTLGRILIIPLFVGLLYFENRVTSFWAAVLFIVAGLTDIVDGLLARRMGLVTVLGKFMDPIADKLLVMSALVMLLYLGRVPAWVVIVILAREFIISALRTLAMSEGVVIAAAPGGKLKTSLQVTALVALIIHYRYPFDFFFLWPVELDAHRVGIWVLYLSLIPGILSAVDYFRAFWAALAETEPGESEHGAAPPAGGTPGGPPRHVSPEVAAPGGSRGS